MAMFEQIGESKPKTLLGGDFKRIPRACYVEDGASYEIGQLVGVTVDGTNQIVSGDDADFTALSEEELRPAIVYENLENAVAGQMVVVYVTGQYVWPDLVISGAPMTVADWQTVLDKWSIFLTESVEG